MKVLFLRHIEVEGPALAGEVCRELGHAVEVLDVSADTAWPVDSGPYGAVVILGGPPSVYERDKNPWLAPEESFLRTAIDAEKPVLGICLGAQILAQMLGGAVEKGSALELGFKPLSLAPEAVGDPLLCHLDPSTAVFHWHGDILHPPPASPSLASTDLTPCQAFRHGRNAWGLQFHVEVTSQDIQAWRAAYPGENSRLPDDFESQCRLHLPAAEARGRALLKAFLTI